MSNTHEAPRGRGYVVIDGEKVLSYHELHHVGFGGTSYQKDYDAGNHGIDGLMAVTATPDFTELFETNGLAVALVETPWFSDKRLAMEPASSSYVFIDEDDGNLVDLEFENGFTKLNREEDGNYIEVTAKQSISFYHTNSAAPQVDLLKSLGQPQGEDEEDPLTPPGMPSAADVLAMMNASTGSSDADAFARAFATPPNPEAPSWTAPVTPAPPASSESLEQTIVRLQAELASAVKAQYTPSSEPKKSAPAPAPKAAPKPMPPASDIYGGMFGPLIK